MSECDCQRKHPEGESRALLKEELKTAQGWRAVFLAEILSPCPSSEED